MHADLVLEGGGAKGVALAGAIAELDEAGYRFKRVAGTSVGALIGALLAAGMPPTELEALARQLNLNDVAPPSRWSRLGNWPRKLAVLFELGVHDHAPLRAWLTEELARYGVRTFEDLRLDDPDDDLRPERRFRLVVTAADVTQGRLVRLPWDAADYGLDPGEMSVADAVAASAALPLAFEPMRLRTRDGRHAVLVDGGLLSRFPIDIFDRIDGRPSRWPSVGLKLSATPPQSGFAIQHPVHGPWSYLDAVLSTAVASWDERHLEDPTVIDRTVFVDTSDVSTLDFSLSPALRNDLVDRGRVAARRWIEARPEERVPHE